MRKNGGFLPKQVSILVLLDDAYRRDVASLAVSLEIVSILVLLDDAYRRAWQNATAFNILGFNPCSSG